MPSPLTSLPLDRLAKGYRRTLTLGAVACTAAALIGEFRFGSSLYLYTDIKDKPGAFQGSMSVVSAFLLVVAGVLMFRASEVLQRSGDRAARGFAGFAALLGFLAFDELAMFHEWVAQKLDGMHVWKPLGIDHDIYVFAVYGAIAALAGLRMLPVILRHRRTLTLVLAMIAFAAFSEGIDFVPWNSLTPAAQTWFGPLEEGLKTMATLSAALYAHALLDAIEQRRDEA